MKVGIVGVGAVGTSCAKAMLLRGSCAHMVLIDLPERAQHTRGVVNDLSHGEPLCAATRIEAGDYSTLADAAIVIITAGINEQSGNATDRSDSLGRLRLLPHNAQVFREIVPAVVASAPGAVILVVTDPPDPLADIARMLVAESGGRNPVLGTGTFLDTLRFRIQIAAALDCHPSSVEALVIGEHGTSQVYVWSSATAGGASVLRLAAARGEGEMAFRQRIETAVKFANIDIIQGTGASQHGIGIVTARIVEAILRDERAVLPVGAWQPQFGVTLSLPAIVGAGGVKEVIMPGLSEAEAHALDASAKALTAALGSIGA